MRTCMLAISNERIHTTSNQKHIEGQLIPELVELVRCEMFSPQLEAVQPA